MTLRPRGCAAFLVMLCLALGSAEVPGSDIDRLVAPGGRTTLRGSLFSPGFSIRHSAPDSVVITLSLGELTVQPRTTRRGLEHHVFLDDGERWERIGAPDLPVYRKLVAVPDGGEVRVTARPRARRLISGVTVLPFEPAVGRVGARADVRGDGIAPRQWVAVEHVGYLRAQRIVSLLIAPARYLPGRRELDVATDLEVVVTVEGSAGDVLKNVGPLQGVLKGTVLNAGAGLSATPNPVSGPGLGAMSAGGQICWCSGSNWQDAAASAISCGADYLMIVSDSLVASTMVDTLALWRAEYNGFNVAIVKMSQIDVEPDTASTPVSIRALIDSVYTSESAMHMGDGHLGYVLLVGDAYDANRKELVPSYYGYADTTGECQDFCVTDPSCFLA